jgi:hypothetical protein
MKLRTSILTGALLASTFAFASASHVRADEIDGDFRQDSLDELQDSIHARSPHYAEPSYAAPLALRKQIAIRVFGACVRDGKHGAGQAIVDCADYAIHIRSPWPHDLVIAGCVAAAIPAMKWPDATVRPICEANYARSLAK